MSSLDPTSSRAPVAFAAVDVQAADELIHRFGRMALRLLPGTPRDERTISRLLSLTTATNTLIANGTAAERGLRNCDLVAAANYATDTHIRELLMDPWIRRWSALTVRLIIASHGRLLAEHLVSAPVRLRRDAVRIGAENRDGVANIKPMLRAYLAGGDCHLVAAQIPMTTASPYDRTSDNADSGLIDAARAALGEDLPDTAASHVSLLIDERASLAQCVGAASEAHPELFSEVGIQAATIVRDAFPKLVILDPLPVGAPRVKGETFAQTIMPGEVPEILEHAVEHGLAGIAACTPPEARPPHTALADPEPGLAAEFGITVSALDVAVAIVDDEYLLRVARSGNGTDLALWRVFGMPSDDPRAAVLAQRAAEPWSEACTTRAQASAPLGMIRATTPAWRRTLYALIAVADAARVIAERTRRADELRLER
jgi:hypothetical protein